MYDGVSALQHVGILCVMYDFLVVSCVFVGYCNYM